ncbi:hypothetical protein EJD97_014425 [Solanum chilense]|uniref:DUF4216 domain-containing protein n=1 Tax=Solanum chilense TaxID=4083 RepID=A0A6N2BBX0_SOLCI|nr:hypothetical protein EJD97_014425 [Solanum chilense]
MIKRLIISHGDINIAKPIIIVKTSLNDLKLVLCKRMYYYSHFKVFLFKCDWYEVEKDVYFLTYVYFNKRCSQEEPFVLASQEFVTQQLEVEYEEEFEDKLEDESENEYKDRFSDAFEDEPENEYAHESEDEVESKEEFEEDTP